MTDSWTPRRNSLIVTDSIRSNLLFLSSILNSNDQSLMSISSSEADLNNQELGNHIAQHRTLYPHIRTLLKNIDSPFKCVGLYSRLLQNQFSDSLPSDPLFSGTFFNARIHPLLTSYLNEQTPYPTMKLQTEKILDVFYKYIFCQHGDLMEANLRDGLVSNLGKWFYEEGIQRMFKRYYYTAHELTKFVSQFMLHGLAAMFLAAVSILSKRSFSPHPAELDLISVAYLRKYGLK